MMDMYLIEVCLYSPIHVRTIYNVLMSLVVVVVVVVVVIIVYDFIFKFVFKLISIMKIITTEYMLKLLCYDYNDTNIVLL
jgi:hypothetical protein